MTDFLITHENSLRLGCFLGLLILFASLEVVFPFKSRLYSRKKRWLSHLLLTVLNSALLKIIFPLAAVGAAHYGATQNIGLLRGMAHWPALLLSLLALDLMIYAQHVLLHHVPLFWRFHKMHHSDPELDVTSAVRFHPFEIIFSMSLKMIFIVLLGPPLAAVIIFEILLNGLALFNHSNLRLPTAFEKILRLFIVTPAMHWIHHSVEVHETNSNYGFNLSLWDRIFRTYKARPDAGYGGLVQGLKEYHAKPPLGILSLLKLPFKKV